MSANIKASTDGTQAIIGVGGTDQMTISNAGVVTANEFVTTGLGSTSDFDTFIPFLETGIVSGGISIYAIQTDATTRKTLRANPVNGGRIVIGGITRQFKSGLTLDTTAYNASTLYYVYAYWTGTAIALELSTTAYQFDYDSSNSGIAVKIGDNSRTLVGLIYLDANKEIVNNVQNNTVINWYNQSVNFLAGQLSAAILPPEEWINYAAEVTARFNPSDPFNAANWQEIGTVSDNKINYLAWPGTLGRQPAVVMGISGTGIIDGEGQALRIIFGTTQRGPNYPISSDMSMTAAANQFRVNVSGSSTIGPMSRQNEVNVWAQIIGTPKAATGDAATDLVTCVGNTFQNNLPVRFISLTGGAGLLANTKYFVRNLSGSDFKLAETALRSGVTGNSGTDVITLAFHGFENNQLVQFTALSGGSGLSTLTDYYVVNKTFNTFQLSLTLGGLPIDFTTNITSGTIGAPIINFTTDITSAQIDANGATVFINSFGSYVG
jgi:hypothetical protein